MERILWTKYEDAWLKQVWPKTEIPAKAIAHALKRTENAIRLRASILKIKRPWPSSPENIEHLKRLDWVGSTEQKEQLKRAREKSAWVGSTEQKEHLERLHETWNVSPENLEHLKQIGKKGREKSRAKPTWPEAIFYGLVYGYNGLAKEFRAQEFIPNAVCDHTVDGRWKDIIFELDGGGHHAFIDRTEHDHLIDAEYQKMGYRVVREETASDLFLRLLQMVEKSKLLNSLNTLTC